MVFFKDRLKKKKNKIEIPETDTFTYDTLICEKKGITSNVVTELLLLVVLENS